MEHRQGELRRRAFLKAVGLAGIGTSCARCSAGEPDGKGQAAFAESAAVLVDLTKCIGCRMCEFACQKEAGLPTAPIATYNDQSVLAAFRTLHPGAQTIINAFDDPARGRPIYTKSNCLHCNQPACVSACPVAALTKQENGAVVYDAEKCMGCRYCMIACPFQVPTYDYDAPKTPEVRKCNLCAQRLESPGGVPACVAICPPECMTYGKRGELLELAHEKIRGQPDLYVDHIYGEHEAGGTSWLYLSSVPFESLEFVMLDAKAPSHLTEAIQHGLLGHFQAPAVLLGLLGAAMWITRVRGGGPPGLPSNVQQGAEDDA